MTGNVTEVLRREYVKESNAYPMFKNNEDLNRKDLCWLAYRLTTPKRTLNHCGSYFHAGGFLVKQDTACISCKEEENHEYIVINESKEKSEEFVNQYGDLLIGETTTCSILGELTEIKKIQDGKYKVLKCLPKKQAEFEVYLPTRKCLVIYKMKTFRNKIYHASRVAITDVEFQYIFKTVREAYELLDVNDEDMKKLSDIENGDWRVT